MKIGLIGAGRLGICLALLMGEAGYKVIASDIREDYIYDLQNKKYNGTEPFVQELLSRSTNVEFTTDNSIVIKESDIIFTLVQTPSLEDGNYDVSAVWGVVDDIKETLDKDLVVPQGFHFIAPWNKVYIYNVKQQEFFEGNMQVLSSNGLEISLDVSVLYL